MLFLKQKEESNKSGLLVDAVQEGGALANNLLNVEPSMRTYDYTRIYLSQIVNSCAREEAIGNLLGLKKYVKVYNSSMLMMNMGTALHHYIQNNPDQFFGEDRFLGFWECVSCSRTRRFGVKPKDNCEHCGASPRATQYKEYAFRLDNPYRISGRVDGIIEVAPCVYRFLDIKTYGAKEELNHAKGDDLAQVASYMYFHQYDESETKLPIKIDQEIGYVVYFLKTMNMKAPQMVFRVKPTDRLLDPLRQKAADFSNAVNTGILPDVLQSCESVHWSSGRAKNCSRKEECRRYHEMGINRIGIS